MQGDIVPRQSVACATRMSGTLADKGRRANECEVKLFAQNIY